MSSEEQIVLDFLRSSPESYFARREVARRAVKRSVFEQTPHWADAPLASLLAQGLIESNDSGQVRFKKFSFDGR